MIDPASGVISVNLLTPLSYWDAPSYQLAVTCTDADPTAPLTTTQVITVALTQVNTVALASINVAFGTPAVLGTNVSGGTALFWTGGGATVEFTGTGFGPTARYIAVASPPATLISATYGPPASPALYTATGCAVYTPNSVVRCTVPPGVGTGHAWTVLVAGAWSASSGALTTAYFPPVISSVCKWDSSLLVCASSNLLSTEAKEPGGSGQLVAVTGSNLSPAAAADLVWQYWSATDPTTVYFGPCRVDPSVLPGTPLTSRLLCTPQPGVGASLSFQVRAMAVAGLAWCGCAGTASLASLPSSPAGARGRPVVRSLQHDGRRRRLRAPHHLGRLRRLAREPRLPGSHGHARWRHPHHQRLE